MYYINNDMISIIRAAHIKIVLSQIELVHYAKVIIENYDTYFMILLSFI